MSTSPRFWFSLVALAALSSCHPSATVERTTPVANLRFYRSVAVRVSAAPGTESQARALEISLLNRLQQKCNFERVVEGSQGTDLVIDLNILHAGRGGSGLIQNQNLAVLDALLVLSDGQNGDLLGSARIHGKSSQVLVSGSSSPEEQAVDVVAKTVGDLLGKSGCTGPRMARPAPPPPPDAGPQVAQGGDAGPGPAPADHHAEAEALNDQGKKKFRSADVAGAMADFQKAASLSPDPRYTFNICLAHEALEQWDQAIAACNRARGMRPSPALSQKIDERIDIIQQRKAGK